MALPKVTINIGEGGLGRTALSKSGISGFLFYNDNIEDLINFSATNRAIKFTNLKAVEATGITSSSTHFTVEHLHISEFFRQGGTELWIGIYADPGSALDYSELATLQQKATGEIRLFGIPHSGVGLDVVNVALINVQLTAFNTAKQSAHAIYCADISDITLALLPDMRDLSADAKFVSVVIGQDTEGTSKTVTDILSGSIPNVGAVLGALARSNVNKNVMNPANYNYTNGVEMTEPGFFATSGSTANSWIKVADMEAADLDSLNTKGYLFWRLHNNYNGVFLSNDHTSTVLTSDYANIHNVRTMNKVVRGVDGALIPLLGINAKTTGGVIDSSTIKRYTKAVEFILNQMLIEEEISEYSIYIDPTQNIASTGTIEIDLAIVPQSTADDITINIGYTAVLS